MTISQVNIVYQTDTSCIVPTDRHYRHSHCIDQTTETSGKDCIIVTAVE